MKICQYFCLHMKIICQRFNVKKPLMFWGIRTWDTSFFYEQRSFSTQPQFCLTFSWIELQMLLRCCLYKHHHTESPFMFTVFVPKSRPRSIHVSSVWSNFHFHLHFHNDYSHEYRRTCYFAYFSEHVLLFLGDNVNEGCE